MSPVVVRVGDREALLRRLNTLERLLTDLTVVVALLREEVEQLP